MEEQDWRDAEEVLFEGSRAIIHQFAQDHPDELFSLFSYSVDSMYGGVGLNFDTMANSLRKAKANQRREVNYRNQLFALDRGWENALYFVGHSTTEIADFNRKGPWKYEIVSFVELLAWDQFFNSPGWEPEDANSEVWAKELEGRIVTTLWRVVNRLVEARAFDGLKRAFPFRILFGFHDDPMMVMRILDWPVDEEGG